MKNPDYVARRRIKAAKNKKWRGGGGVGGKSNKKEIRRLTHSLINVI